MTTPPLHTATLKLAGTTCTFETGRIARQASGAVVGRCGELVILATVVGARAAAPGADFFPLTVEYREKAAAVGRIPGTYQRREGRITDREILLSRLIDRTLRSLFPKNYRAEVQVQVTVMSADPAVDPTSLALLAACAAVHVSPLPCEGPAAGLRILGGGGTHAAFPTQQARRDAELDFVVSCSPDGLVMVEGTAAEASEADCVAALEQAQSWLGRARKAIADLAASVGTTKWPAPAATELPEVDAEHAAELQRLLEGANDKEERRERYRDFLARVLDGSDADAAATLRASLDAKRTELTRKAILAGRRPDGRGPSDIRPIWGEVGWLPRAHGSAIFTRGETQALVTCTLGSPEDALRHDDLEGTHSERFILHYGFPPYSVGETRPLRGPGRREIGHGNLARTGLLPLLPDDEGFPYTIRVESEISESNGSSSMATVCGGTLAMFCAGVPLQRAVAGIAMGMVAEGDQSVVLSDIVGEEDHLGDMDFKVVGTDRGVTALQLDNKIGGLPMSRLADALEQAASGRRHILDAMRSVLAEPAQEMPPSAPRVARLEILPDSVGMLVGPRGATIKQIQKSTGARISVSDDGTVLIYAADGPMASNARAQVQQLVGVLEIDHYYRGVVTSVRDFGAFVKVNDCNEGLVAKDQIAEQFVERPADALSEGDAVTVKLLDVDDRGRLKFSIREAIGVDPSRVDF